MSKTPFVALGTNNHALNLLPYPWGALCVYSLSPAVQLVHRGPGRHTVPFCDERSAPCLSLGWAASYDRPSHGRGTIQWEILWLSHESPSSLSQSVLAEDSSQSESCWIELTGTIFTHEESSRVSGVCGLSTQPGLTTTQPLGALWSLRLSRGQRSHSLKYFLKVSLGSKTHLFQSLSLSLN